MTSFLQLPATPKTKTANASRTPSRLAKPTNKTSLMH